MKYKPLTVEQLNVINAYHQWFNDVATDAERKGEIAYLNAIAEPNVMDLLTDDEPEPSHYHRQTETPGPTRMRLPGQD